MKGLGLKLKKYWRLFWHFRRMRLMTRMAYSVNFFIMLVGVFLQMAFSIIFVRIIFGFIGNLAGWGYYQALIVVATYMLVDGLMWVLCAYLGSLEMHIKEGTLDGLLIKPVDTQFLVTIWRGDPEDAVRLVSGGAVLFYALSNLNFNFAWLAKALPAYAALVLCAFFINYSIVLVFRSVTFWVIEGGAFYEFNNAIAKMAQYPTDIFYHAIIRMVFMTVVPLAFMATVPARILAYGFNWQLFLSAILIATIFVWGSRRFWLFALRHYTSASS